ncbi:putative MFS family arabinose efflux permease [Anoxybacillus vitaminiphilus]|uniref:Putative MFS family arabinose efflux permease n=1 Tax=Paranoxybacillus vitaminiphilus TaxID=581036 RepID=A0A327Y8R8_9BACL|nr:MFS transporter [Anoxybacillus vitaminiphilus]RAK16891.1 putative MFS family arabinose efflux permease [Anoxybacillus vitaminiphilus]
MKQERLWTKNFVSVAAANFFTFITFYYLLVTLPMYAMEHLHSSPSSIGLITAVFLIAAIITRPFAGKWMEKAGKYVVFLSALAILGAASFFYFLPHSLPALLLLRLLHGIGFGMATTANGAIVADLIPDSRKGEGMGYYGLTQNLAMVAGPFLGLTAMQQGATTMFAANALFALLSLAAGLFVRLPENRAARHVKLPTNKIRLLETSAIPVSLVSAFFGLMYSAIISFVSIYAKEAGFAEAANYFFIVYAGVLLLSRPFTGKWFDLYGANVIVYPAIVCFAVGTYLLSISETALLFLVSAALIGLGWGTVFPSLQTIAIQVAHPQNRGLATATFLSIFDFGFAIGSFLFGLAAAKISYSSLYFYSTFFIIAGIGLYYLLHGHSGAENSNPPVKYRKQTKVQ